MISKMVNVTICGIPTQVRKTYYDWVEYRCRRRWSSYPWPMAGNVYAHESGQPVHLPTCPCSDCKAWNEEARLHRLMELDHV